MSSHPRLDFSQISWQGLCPRWTPLKLSGWIRQWLIAHFVDANNIYEPVLQKRLWVGDAVTGQTADNTGIIIETISNWLPRTTETRPAIILKRHELNILRQGVGDNRLQGNSVGRKLYSILYTGSHTAYCIARTDGECEILASEVNRELLQFGPIVREELGLVRVALVGLGELAKLEEASENFVIPVTISYAFWDSWEITTDDSSPLSRVDLTVQP